LGPVHRTVVQRFVLINNWFSGKLPLAFSAEGFRETKRQMCVGRLGSKVPKSIQAKTPHTDATAGHHAYVTRTRPGCFLAKVFQLRDELVRIGEPISDDRLTDIIVEGLTSEYDQVKYSAERDPGLSIGDIETTLRNMYANRLAR
ncbi:unnamed protein product, partial [Sphacelaria rigidula]